MENTYIPDSKSLGAIIRAKRKEQKLRIDTAAVLCCVSVQFLHDLEIGKPTVQFDKTLHVAKMLGISLYACHRTMEGLHEPHDT